MKTVQVYLNSIQKVNSFSHELEQFDNDFDLVSGRYIVDAKSVMGIFSLDLNEPTTSFVTTSGMPVSFDNRIICGLICACSRRPWSCNSR